MQEEIPSVWERTDPESPNDETPQPDRDAIGGKGRPCKFKYGNAPSDEDRAEQNQKLKEEPQEERNCTHDDHTTENKRYQRERDGI